MSLFSRTKKIVLSGFAGQDAYDRREPTWEPEDAFDSLATATAAGRSWVEGAGPGAVVEVIEMRGRRGTVVRLVTGSGHEDIRSPWRLW